MTSIPGTVGFTVDHSISGFGSIDHRGWFVTRSKRDDSMPKGGLVVIVAHEYDKTYIITHKCVVWNATRVEPA